VVQICDTERRTKRISLGSDQAGKLDTLSYEDDHLQFNSDF
jgi:hypothetical protein